jgi:hypothetical protein
VEVAATPIEDAVQAGVLERGEGELEAFPLQVARPLLDPETRTGGGVIKSRS